MMPDPAESASNMSTDTASSAHSPHAGGSRAGARETPEMRDQSPSGHAALAGGALDWSMIDTVLLDLDGTLLDLGFDNDFWLERVPQAYAAAQGIAIAEARELLAGRFRACEGTLAWYCIEHWSRELGLDVAALKRACAERIAWLPGAREFVVRIRAAGKRLVLLTNSHPLTLAIKDERTGVSELVHAAFSSHEFGVPKEDPRFWRAVQQAVPFDRYRALFVDDSPAVLRAAVASGIRFVYGVSRPDSRGTPRVHEQVAAVDAVRELLDFPGLESQVAGTRP
jgi:5'-nucleotidase